MKRLVFFLAITMVFLWGCPSGSDDNAYNLAARKMAAAPAASPPEPALGVTQALAANGLQPLAEVEYGGNRGYLAGDENGRHCLVLTGAPYNMGYQMGYLMPAGTCWSTTVYPYVVGAGVLNLAPQDAPELIDFLAGQIMTLCRDVLPAIPAGLVEEMHGLAAGARARGYDVTFEDVLLLNQGLDAIYAMLYTGRLPCMPLALADLPGLLDPALAALPGSDPKIEFLQPLLMGCNEFVVAGNSTPDGKVYHGRDFMFSTGELYQDYACQVVYLPDEGLPFLAVSSPGFIGHPTAVNAAGLSIGADVVYAACSRSDPGLGSALVMRDIVQHAPDLGRAVQMLTDYDRGVAWIYVLADDDAHPTWGHGLVVEEGMSAPHFSGPDLLPLWQQLVLASWIELLDETQPERGIMLRDLDWTFPSAFQGTDLRLPYGPRAGTYAFDQLETWPDVVMTTNHYLIPRMALTMLEPWVFLAGAHQVLPNSMWRYKRLFELMDSEYGRIDAATARNLIDFLNPNSVYGDTGWYRVDTPVRGHHALIDNRERVVEALFGYYGPAPDHRTPWMRIDLKPFVRAWADEKTAGR